MSDLIDREKFIYTLIFSEKTKSIFVKDLRSVIEVANEMPSAEPERKKGEWVEISWTELDPNVCFTSYEMQSAKCSVCGKYHTTPYLYSLDYFPYCPNCGAEMKRGE